MKSVSRACNVWFFTLFAQQAFAFIREPTPELTVRDRIDVALPNVVHTLYGLTAPNALGWLSNRAKQSPDRLVQLPGRAHPANEYGEKFVPRYRPWEGLETEDLEKAYINQTNHNIWHLQLTSSPSITSSQTPSVDPITNLAHIKLRANKTVPIKTQQGLDYFDVWYIFSPGLLSTTFVRMYRNARLRNAKNEINQIKRSMKGLGLGSPTTFAKTKVKTARVVFSSALENLMNNPINGDGACRDLIYLKERMLGAAMTDFDYEYAQLHQHNIPNPQDIMTRGQGLALHSYLRAMQPTYTSVVEGLGYYIDELRLSQNARPIGPQRWLGVMFESIAGEFLERALRELNETLHNFTLTWRDESSLKDPLAGISLLFPPDSPFLPAGNSYTSSNRPAGTGENTSLGRVSSDEPGGSRRNMITGSFDHPPPERSYDLDAVD